MKITVFKAAGKLVATLALATVITSVATSGAFAQFTNSQGGPSIESFATSGSAPAGTVAGGNSGNLIQVCFFTEAEFKGRTFCENGARGVREVAPAWRDDIESILINAPRVKVCDDFNREGTCETLTRSVAQLTPELRNKVYSYRISN